MGYEIDFLSVGNGEKSGDAIALRYGNLFGDRSEQTVVIIDGGYKESGEKLVEHIDEYYKTDSIDIVISTHPDADHSSGLEVVINEFEVGALWMHQPWNHTEDIENLFEDGRVTDNSVRQALRKSLESALSLEKLAESKGIPIIEPFRGVTDSTGSLFVVGPSEEFYEGLLPYFRETPEPKSQTGLLTKALEEAKELIKKIAEKWDIETLDDSGETSAENNSSVILLLNTDNRSLLLTADAGIPALTDVADALEYDEFDFCSLQFIQVPHHGSKRNVGPTILNRLVGPKLKEEDNPKTKTAFVSASKNVPPKHPSKKVTNAFKRRGAPVCATQGQTIRHLHDAPKRDGWTKIMPLPFYYEVEE